MHHSHNNALKYGKPNNYNKLIWYESIDFQLGHNEIPHIYSREKIGL